MELAVTMFDTVCEFFIGCYITKTYLHKSYKPQCRDFLACCCLLLVCILIPDHEGILTWACAHAIYLTYVCTQQKRGEASLQDRYLLFCLMHNSMLMIEGIFSVPLILLLRLIPMPELLFMLIANITLTVLTPVLFLIPALRNMYNKIRYATLPFRLILINSYMALLFLLLSFKLNLLSLYKDEISAVIYCCTTLFLIAINIWILYYDQRTRLQQQEIDSYQKNMPIYDSLIQEIRAGQHEYANHLQSLANLSVMYKDYDSLSRALQSYSQEFSNPMANYPLLQINMPLLAASLYSMASHAQEKGIALQFDIVNAVLESHAPEHELTDYITILTQNAIEACKAGDTIYALLDSKEGSVQYEIRNPVPAMISPEEIGNFFKRGYSTKQTQAGSDAASKRASSDATSKQADDKRGLGLYYLQTNVTKSGGSVGADCVCYEGSCHMTFRLML